MSPLPKLYVDPESSATQQARAWATTDPEGARLMTAYAAHPKAVWLTTSTTESSVAKLLAVDGERVLVTYNIPARDNDDDGGSSHSGQDEPVSGAEYTSWVAAIAKAIKASGKKPFVIIEPDAIALASKLSDDDARERYALIRDSIRVLKAAGARTFLDCGDSNWIPAKDMVVRMLQAGIFFAEGFATNCAHHESDADEHAWAKDLRERFFDLMGRRPKYVMDSGRNGQGNTDDDWCNAKGVGVGRRPTLKTGVAGCVGIFWVKGLSLDGACNGYTGKAGSWDPKRARELCERAVPPL